jgi:ribosome maturation protein SDO1
MVSVEKAVIARLHKNGKNFEILVDPDKSLEFKNNPEMPIEDVLAAQEIFTDSRKGDRPMTSRNVSEPMTCSR